MIEGVVRNASGEPVAEALVVLVSADPRWSPADTPPTERVRTSKDGRFRIEGAPAGAYALNVTAPGLTTSYRTGLQLAADQQLQGQDVRLEASGALLRGTVKKQDGASVPEAWVAVARVSDDNGDIAYVRADTSGAWSIQVVPGEYTLYAEAPGLVAEGRPATATQGEPRPLDIHLSPAPVKTPAPVEVVEWVKKTAVPLATVEAGHGFADLQPLTPALAKSRVVALGEATHGSREFFQLKHRMLEWLATEQGFTLFGIEANFAEALAVNEYVLTGKGDPGAALAGMYFWVWDTEEVLSLIQWMRAYNADPKHPKKLRFYGFDMQFSPGSTKALLAYFQKVDGAFGKTLEEPLRPLLSKDAFAPGAAPPPEKLAVIQARLAEVQKRLKEKQAAYVRKSSERDWAFTGRHAELLAYLTDRASKPRTVAFASRDRIMAENIRWLLEQEGPDAKMVAWAHNLHVGTNKTSAFSSMGQHLREALGDSLYIFGFVFNQGSFQARTLQPSEGVIVHTVAPASAGTLDTTLASAGLPLFALDLRPAPQQGAVATFLREPRLSRQIGSVYADGAGGVSTTPRAEFDGLLFVEKTSASIPTPTGRRLPGTIQ